MYETPPIPDHTIATVVDPCPFCGSVNLTLYRDPLAVNFFIRCHQCGSSGPSTRSHSLIDVAATWNHRSTQPKACLERDRYRAALERIEADDGATTHWIIRQCREALR